MGPVLETGVVRESSFRAAIAGTENSIRAYPQFWTYFLLSAGLLVRIWYASGTFLNPDEAMHFAAANQPSWWLTYMASLRLAHPPLLIFFLHLWRHIGTGELTLRLPETLAGLAFCWFTFRWLSELFSAPVAWAGFLLALFLPSSIQLSTEVRQYAFLLAFEMGATYWLERALAKRSWASMLFSGVCLWMALLSHFSAFLFAAVLAIYGLWRLVKLRPRLPILAAWELGQIVAAGIGYFLYINEIPELERFYGGFSLTQGFMGSGFLAKYYFAPGTNPLVFVFARSGGFFQYIFQQLVVGDLAFALFLAGVVLVFRGVDTKTNRVHAGFLLLAPFAVNCLAAMVKAYPYGGTRHSAFLLPFAIAGVSVALVWICRNRLAMTILVALALSVFSLCFRAKQFEDAPPGAQKIANMDSAIEFVRQLPAGEPVFTDLQSSLLLVHYLCKRQSAPTDESQLNFITYACGGHRIMVARHDYIFTQQRFQDSWKQMVLSYKVPRDKKVWIAQLGTSMHLEEELEAAGLNLAPHRFGSEISFFDMRVGATTP